MKTISAGDAKDHLSLYLDAIERGEEFVIARGETPIALLSPISKPASKPRPKVGETLGPRMSVPDSAFAPMTEAELKEWTG